jgi:hypothetical protein
MIVFKLVLEDELAILKFWLLKKIDFSILITQTPIHNIQEYKVTLAGSLYVGVGWACHY